jgi:PTS system galactitol-specific IIA component
VISTVTADLTLVRPDVSDSTSLLRLMAEQAHRAGLVRDTFADAVVEREARFPTGLPTAVPAAIPHTDATHVVGAGLVVALLADPVEFVEMGSTDRTVRATLVVMLLVQDPAEQVTALGEVIAMLQDPGLADRLAGLTVPEDVVRALVQRDSAAV